MGWSGEKRAKREKMHEYVELIHFTVQQKLAQHCKAIIFQQKKKERKKNYTGIKQVVNSHQKDNKKILLG